jgi:hypothetical protein
MPPSAGEASAIAFKRQNPVTVTQRYARQVQVSRGGVGSTFAPCYRTGLEDVTLTALSARLFRVAHRRQQNEIEMLGRDGNQHGIGRIVTCKDASQGE